MWGIREDGTSQKNVALDRLTRWCMGRGKPAIVGFGSSAGFDAAYCKKNPQTKVCAVRGGQQDGTSHLAILVRGEAYAAASSRLRRSALNALNRCEEDDDRSARTAALQPELQRGP